MGPLVALVQEQLDLSESLTEKQTVAEKLEVQMEGELQTQTRLLEELDAAKEKATRTLEDAANNDKQFDADAHLEPADALHRQVLDLTAEDAAYDDLLGTLGELLSNRQISVADWCFEYRDLIKKQFLVRELQRKVIRTIRARRVGKMT